MIYFDISYIFKLSLIFRLQTELILVLNQSGKCNYNQNSVWFTTIQTTLYTQITDWIYTTISISFLQRYKKKTMQRSVVQQVERLVFFFGIMGDRLRVPLKPPVHDCSMVPRSLRGTERHVVERHFDVIFFAAHVYRFCTDTPHPSQITLLSSDPIWLTSVQYVSLAHHKQGPNSTTKFSIYLYINFLWISFVDKICRLEIVHFGVSWNHVG